MLLFKEDITRVLRTAPANLLAVELLEMIESKWSQVALASSAVILVWTGILNPFHAKLSLEKCEKLNFGETKSVWIETEDKLKRVLNSVHPLEELFRVVVAEENKSSLTLKVLPIIDQIRDTASENDLIKISNDCKKGVEAVLEKFCRDKLILFSIYHDDSDFVPSNNRKTESSFSDLKHIERQYIGMCQQTVQTMSKAKANGLDKWMKSLSKKDLAKIIYASKRSRAECRIERMKTESDNRKKRLRTYSI